MPAKRTTYPPTSLQSIYISVASSVLATELTSSNVRKIIGLTGCLRRALNMMNNFFRSGTFTLPVSFRLAYSYARS